MYHFVRVSFSIFEQRQIRSLQPIFMRGAGGLIKTVQPTYANQSITMV